MSGKVYTMKEMKNIVTYLTEHKAYGEIRGRKMWVDFANSNSTTRTWQSLKETFLKRILPDIHNPYYNLTREQIISFRQGYDVDQRDKNKLEIETVAEIHKDNENVISSDEEPMPQGEKDKCSNIVSKDFPDQNNCYKTADDIRRDLESPKVDEEEKPKTSNTEQQSLAVQNVLNDFASDSEDAREIIQDVSAVEDQNKSDSDPLKDNPIDKTIPSSDNDVQELNAEELEVKVEKENSVVELSESKDTDSNKDTNEKIPTEPRNENVGEKNISHDILEISSTNKRDCDTTSNKKNETSETAVTPLASSCQPLTNSTSDTILPNNQEGLKDQAQNNNKADDSAESNINLTKKSSTKPIRKRSSSAETVLLENKRQKKNSTSNTSEKNCDDEEIAHDPEVFEVNDSDNSNGRATSTQVNKAGKINQNASRSDNEEPQTQNPCLKSVSLFAEQFNKTKYSDSTSDDNAVQEMDPKPSGSKEVRENSKEADKDEIVVLKSHSESESGEEEKKKPTVSKHVAQAQRDKALANAFGFNSGAVSTNRKRKASQNRVRRPHNVQPVNGDTDSDSSEWTTDNEQDNFILPPRGRTNRKTRKYLKPKSTRILSLEEEGGLFVMYGKRIYPIVKDGRIVKNYVIYESNSDSGFEQDSYWKAKYAELKKKYEEHKKTKEPSERLREKRQSSVSKEPSSPILQSSGRKNPPIANRDIYAPSTSHAKPVIDNKELETNCPVENKMSSDKIVIKYTINNAEVQLEGNWPQICPIFDKVLDILPRKTDSQMDVAKNNKLGVQEQPKVISSGESTPVIITGDTAIQEKMDKLESEIFKEIEEKDKEDELEKDKGVQLEKNKGETSNNVTTRKRGRQITQSTPQKSPIKQPRTTKAEEESSMANVKRLSEAVEKQSKVDIPIQNSPQIITRSTRRSMKATLESQKVRASKSSHGTPKPSNVIEGTQEDDIRYMFPPATEQTSSNKQKPKSFAEQIVFQDDDSSLVSESTHGYQDSDISPVKLKRRRKLRLSTITHRNKLQSKRKQRRNSYPQLIHEASTDSSSSFCGSIKTKSSDNSSTVYKSDSYQYLFPQAKKSVRRLEPIKETSPTVNEVEMRSFDNVCRSQLNTDATDSDAIINGNTIGSSSNISLPQSPELSVVEDISIGREFLNSINVYHSLRKAQANEVAMNEEQNKYVITNIDVTMPLMEQMCVLQKSTTDVSMKKLSNDSKRQKKPSVSESLLNKICKVNIDDNSSVCDSLDIKLRDLLLESAKKMSKTAQSKENMEIDENILSTMQKSKSKKRCSTPRKKKETIKSKLLTTGAAVEQHMETCSYAGKKSCPPSIQVQDTNSVNNTEIDTGIVQVAKPKGRNKKDVIKVKILRPRNRSVLKGNTEKSTNKASRMSICTDSGINGTESGTSFPISSDSVELIHNHSETCLHANECFENSVEFVEASTSLISVNSSSLTTDWQDSKEFRDADNMSLCSLNNNVNGALTCSNVKCIKTYINEGKSETIYKSPINNEVLNSSLITEDLSDEAPVQPRLPPDLSSWYLLSEDETTNTNFVPPLVPSTGGFGSNLNQIFPVTCAIPDLSTITEMSKENDSRKPFGLDSFSRDSNSRNIFL